MSAHTPAPWKYIDRAVMEDGSVYPPHINGGARELEVCSFFDHESDEMVESVTDIRSSRANARLIAAAPDQNAALIGLNDFVMQAQTIVTNYLIPDGLSKDEFIDQIIAHLDDPVQRIAQGNAVRAIAKAQP